MSNRTLRMEILKESGENCRNYISLILPEGIKAGDKIKITIGNNDDHADLVISQIMDDGFVKNETLFRRWVMAQMFKMLNYKPLVKGKGNSGYNAYLNDCFNYEYQFKVMLDECKLLAKLEKEGKQNTEEYKIRSSFFTKDVIVATCCHYIANAKLVWPHINFSYVIINSSFSSKESGYKKLYQDLKQFYHAYVKRYKVNKNTLKCREWKNAYKGAGAYYTLANLVCSHGCCVKNEMTNSLCYGEEAMECVNRKYEEYNQTKEWWRLFAYMKEVIQNNNIDTTQSLK